MTLLAIDIGTSSAKAVLFDPQTAQIIATVGNEYPVNKPTPDRAEQNPEDWWNAVVHAVRAVLRDVNADSIAAIGLTGQMHGTVLLGADQTPIHSAIIWADQRSAETVKWLIESFGENDYTRLAGTRPATGFMVSTLAWLQRNEPELLVRTQHVLLPKDEIRRRLTGEIATDISDAASTGLLDVTNGVWAKSITECISLDDALLPPILPSAQVAGELTRSAADALGLKAGIPVVAGCADQPAQALANGLLQPGIASVTTGTGGQVFIPLRVDNDALPTDPRLHVFNHAVPQTWYALGAILSAGSALRWLRNVVGLKDTPDAYAILSAEAAHIPPGADGLIFVPYLSGERTPYMDPLARGAFIGLTDYHGRGHLARAVMEGVTYALRQTLTICRTLTGEVDHIIVSGGGAESDVWRQIQADVFDLPLQKSQQPEQTCIGAAMLAGVGTGVYTSFDDAVARVVKAGEFTEPDSGNHRRYMLFYDQFLPLYRRLMVDNHRLAKITENL